MNPILTIVTINRNNAAGLRRKWVARRASHAIAENR
jgi:hypothetical protein